MQTSIEITIPAGSYDLCTVDQLRELLSAPSSITDLFLGELVTRASKAAVKLCRRGFIAETITEQWRSFPHVDSASLANFPNNIWLHRPPIVSVISVVEDAVTLVPGTDYEIDTTRGRITRLCNDIPLRWRFRKLEIEYQGGYTFPDGTLPEDVQAGVLELAKDLYFSRGRDPMVRAENVPGVLEKQYWVGGVGDDGSAWPQRAVDYLAGYIRATV